MKKLLMGLTAAAVLGGSVAVARPVSADEQSTSTLVAMLSTLIAIEAQLVQIEHNTRSQSNP
jgi:hypothetical protein